MVPVHRLLAIVAAYVVLIVLVCPDIPTPIYTCLGKARVQPWLADMPSAGPTHAVTLLELTRVFWDLPCPVSPRAGTLTCQLLC